MASASSIQNKLNVKIFNKFGSDITIENVSSSSLNNYGDANITYSAGVTAVGVPYNQIAGRSWESFGDLNEGDIDIIFKYTETINIDDRVTFGGVQYKVVRREDYPYDNSNLAILVRVAKIL